MPGSAGSSTRWTRADLWESTAVIVTTDHGHYLGEKDVWGKPQVPLYEPLGHIPLLVAWPGVGAAVVRRAHRQRRRHATLCDLFSASAAAGDARRLAGSAHHG